MIRTPLLGALTGALLLSVGCGSPGDGPLDDLGSLRVAISGLPADTPASLTVAGPDGFVEAVTATVTLSDLEPGTYTVDAPDVAAGEAVYTSTVNPAAGVLVAGGGTATLSVVYTELDAVGPRITAVSIVDADGSLMVREGAGEVTLEVTGEDLGGATIARLGAVGGSIDANNGSSVIATFDIGPEVPVGPLALEIVADAGVATLDDAVTVTPTTASGTGDDATGLGTPDSPLRTITAALALAPEGGDIQLLPGSYDEAAGETFPLTIEDRQLVGAGPDQSIVQGPGGVAGLFLGGAATIADLAVTGFTTGVRVQSGDAVLRDIEVWGNSSDGFNVSVNTTNPVTSVAATDCRFRDNGLHGFEAATPADSPVPYVLTGVTSADNGQRGIYLVQSVQMTLIDSVVEGNDFQGISMLQDSRLEAIGVTVRDNDLEGVLGSGNTTLVIEDALIRGQQQHGIEFSGQSLRLRDADVLNNVAGAVRIAGEPVVDLGTLADPGGNRLGIDGAGIALGDHLHDDRPSDSEPAISAVGVSLGANPAHTGLVTGPDNDSPFWAIDRAGNQIDFGN